MCSKRKLSLDSLAFSDAGIFRRRWIALEAMQIWKPGAATFYLLRGWRHSALTWSHHWDVFNYNVRWNKIDMLELKKWQYLCKTPSCDTKVMLCWIKILPIFPGQWKRWGLLIEVWWCLFLQLNARQGPPGQWYQASPQSLCSWGLNMMLKGDLTEI